MLVLLAACGPPTVEDLASSVVRVEADPCGQRSVGSGSVIDDELVLTNAHIVAGSIDDVTVRLSDDQSLSAIVVGFDPDRDLALLRVDGLALDAIELGESESEDQAVILARSASIELTVIDTSVVKGFTATGDDIYGEGDVSRRALELAADVAPGVSGAGVFDSEGVLVGVVFAESRQLDNVTYAVAGNEVAAFVAAADADTQVDTLRCR